MADDLQCCVVSCEKLLDQNYWDAQYQNNSTGWDLGCISQPIKVYFDTIEDKSIAILIPGCGNSYEAEYLLAQGFTNITVIDIAPTLVENLKSKFKGNAHINIVLGDFFELDKTFDLIVEQTFFCALPPSMRQKYVWKMHQLLSNNGKIAGLLFNRNFDVSPPFGGSKSEYELLFAAAFELMKIEICQNSIDKRKDSELAIEFQKNTNFLVQLYAFEGITCSGCKKTVSDLFSNIEGVKNVSMSTDFSEILIVSTNEIPLPLLQSLISYDEKYKIVKI
jgi:SAM-dependent methyltransferase